MQNLGLVLSVLLLIFRESMRVRVLSHIATFIQFLCNVFPLFSISGDMKDSLVVDSGNLISSFHMAGRHTEGKRKQIFRTWEK